MIPSDMIELALRRGALVVLAALGLGAIGPATSAQAPDYKAGRVVEDVWKPAATPKGGVSWKVLEATGETTRIDADGFIVSKPRFTPQVRALAGKRITVAGWMTPLTAGRTQKHFVLLAYPPGCPFHFHAAPNQFIEVYAATPFPTSWSTNCAMPCSRLMIVRTSTSSCSTPRRAVNPRTQP